MVLSNVPEGWTEIDTEFSQQKAAYQRRRDGLVVSFETGVTRDKFSVSLLPENFAQDNQVIRSMGDNGYLYSGDSLDAAEEKAKDWMENNSRQ